MSNDTKHDSGKSPIKPLDLPALRQWITKLADDYGKTVAKTRPRSERKAAKEARSVAVELDALKGDLTGAFGSAKAESVLRRWLAVGLVQYVKVTGSLPLSLGSSPDRGTYRNAMASALESSRQLAYLD